MPGPPSRPSVTPRRVLPSCRVVKAGASPGAAARAP
jgi:hypothetical protein